MAAGLNTALISGLISGGLNVAFYMGGAILKGEKTSFSDVMSSFGDGLASGFMFGVFFGVSMAFGSGLRFVVAKSPQLAQKFISNGKINEFLLKRMVPAGAKNSFVPSARISEGY